MISFHEALNLLLQNTTLLPAEPCEIEASAGRILREEIRADRAFPPFDRVMMDGFALRSVDLQSSRSFRITGSAPAGKPSINLSNIPCSCIEVMTGAPLPIGADCIVPVEMTSPSGSDEIQIAKSFEFTPGYFIHPAGSDAMQGEVLLSPGNVLGSREIGVAASCGAVTLAVSSIPKIAVLATGDELVAVNESPEAHQIRESNAHAIRAALERAGFQPAHVGILGDEPTEANLLRQYLHDCDWLIVTGAVSKGGRDFIPALLDSLGCTRIFHGVAQRPGKPAGCWVGPTGQMIMALPGNPVSALTGLHAFVFPALAVASGRKLPQPRFVIPEDRIGGLPNMTIHLPVQLGANGRAQPAPTGNSGDFIGLLKSDGFITIPPRSDLAAAFPFTPWL